MRASIPLIASSGYVRSRPEADEEARFPAVEEVFPVASAGGAPGTDVCGVRGIHLAVGYVPGAVGGSDEMQLSVTARRGPS